jgi:hypothetical protein
MKGRKSLLLAFPTRDKARSDFLSSFAFTSTLTLTTKEEMSGEGIMVLGKGLDGSLEPQPCPFCQRESVNQFITSRPPGIHFSTLLSLSSKSKGFMAPDSSRVLVGGLGFWYTIRLVTEESVSYHIGMKK